MSAEPRDHEVVELLQDLIRNRCVNDGSDSSGQEVASAERIAGLLEGAGADFQSYEPLPGRVSIVSRIEGSDPGAASLCYLAHTDVVPVNESAWDQDPFGGELVDGEVWGRGAVDMLNLTSSMSIAFARLVESGFKPKGTLVLAAVADEEALGTHGASYLSCNEADVVGTDYLVTEFGGLPLVTPGGKLLPVPVAEKGSCWCRLRVSGEPSHASMPLRTDNALVSAAHVVSRLASFSQRPEIGDTWRAFVEAAGFDEATQRALVDESSIDDLLAVLPDIGLARQAHACTHTTVAPTIAHGGNKINIIPDTVEIDVDIRTLPGWTEQDVRQLIAEAVGDLMAKVEIVEMHDDPPTASPVDTPLWSALEKITRRAHPDGKMIPFLMTGATDARFFRRLGTVAYGFGAFSDRIPFGQFAAMFHGHNERIDVESLALSAEAFEQLARDFLS